MEPDCVICFLLFVFTAKKKSNLSTESPFNSNKLKTKFYKRCGATAEQEEHQIRLIFGLTCDSAVWKLLGWLNFNVPFCEGNLLWNNF